MKKKTKADTRIGKASKATSGAATAPTTQKPWNEPRFIGRQPKSWYYVNSSGSIDVVAGGPTRMTRILFNDLRMMFAEAVCRRQHNNRRTVKA